VTVVAVGIAAAGLSVDDGGLDEEGVESGVDFEQAAAAKPSTAISAYAFTRWRPMPVLPL
jgi:hypothetical protein